MDGFLKKISENLKMRFTALKNYRLLVVLGIIGMILILMSELISSGEQQKDANEKLYRRSEYEEYMERQVEKILGKMEGVGKVNVMLTVEGTEEYVMQLKAKKTVPAVLRTAAVRVKQTVCSSRKAVIRRLW